MFSPGKSIIIIFKIILHYHITWSFSIPFFLQAKLVYHQPLLYFLFVTYFSWIDFVVVQGYICVDIPRHTNIISIFFNILSILTQASLFSSPPSTWQKHLSFLTFMSKIYQVIKIYNCLKINLKTSKVNLRGYTHKLIFIFLLLFIQIFKFYISTTVTPPFPSPASLHLLPNLPFTPEKG